MFVAGSLAARALRSLAACSLAVAGLLASACTDANRLAPSGGGAGAGGEAGGGSGADVEFLNELPTTEAYASLAAEAAEVKYLATVDGREPEAALAGAECLFQNTSKYAYHVEFLRTLPGYEGLSSERYADLVLRRESRTMWGGGMRLFPATLHP